MHKSWDVYFTAVESGMTEVHCCALTFLNTRVISIYSGDGYFADLIAATFLYMLVT